MHTAGQAADPAAADAALEAAAKRAARKERTAPRIRQLAGFLVALLFVLGILVAWGYAQNLQYEEGKAKWALRAEFLFLGLVLWWGLVALSPWLSRLSRWIDDTVEVPPISNVQGLVWSAGILIGVPLAIEYRPWGTAIAIVVAVGSVPAIVLARRRWERVPNAPLCFSCIAGTLAVLSVAISAEPSDEYKVAGAPPGLVAEDHAEVLARDLRPLIFFDSKENFRPVDVAKAICRKQERPKCDVARMKQYAGNLPGNAPLRDGLALGQTPIFHHVFRDGERVYIDYWWFFAHNPTPVLRGFVCGRALTRGWLGQGCAEHAADWEGITLVLKRGCSATAGARSCIRRHGATYEIHAVHYAQHEHVVVYPWKHLQHAWGQRQRDWPLLRNYTHGRPLVFVALNSHASYAMPCIRVCWQLGARFLTEPRDGGAAWDHNDTCRNCVVKIPTDGGGKPVAWAKDPKPYGKPNCILFETYCDGQPAPRGPAFQTRYKDPCPPAGGNDHHHCRDGAWWGRAGLY
jgi:hypothetical protein